MSLRVNFRMVFLELRSPHCVRCRQQSVALLLSLCVYACVLVAPLGPLAIRLNARPLLMQYDTPTPELQHMRTAVILSCISAA